MKYSGVRRCKVKIWKVGLDLALRIVLEAVRASYGVPVTFSHLQVGSVEVRSLHAAPISSPFILRVVWEP